MNKVDRRTFLHRTALAGGAAFALQNLVARSGKSIPQALAQTGSNGSYGPLIDKATRNTGELLLALPEGFQYTVIGRRRNPNGTPNIMSDGRPTPGLHDGQATFAMDDGMIRLVRNHEQGAGAAFGAKPYDAGAAGGTVTLIVDPITRTVVRDFASLSGTVRNCAGGPTPWGTWISNEETIEFPIPAGNANSNSYQKVHGYNFDVPAAADSEVDPLPLKAMGRFSHEAVAIDPATNIIYETEDANPSGFYRFIPANRGVIGQASSPPDMTSGVLQMLAIKERPRYDTRTRQTMGQSLETTWVEIKNPDPLLENGALSVVNQGRARGGAVFARLEGAWYGKNTKSENSIFFVSTSGGDIGRGQIFEFTPDGDSDAGLLTLIFESPSADVLDAPDNICVSPRGGLVLCEDGSGEEFVHGLSQDGQIFKFAKNIVPGETGSEFAGAVFSPDGETLFVNIQGPGLTFAIWPESGRKWSDGAL